MKKRAERLAVVRSEHVVIIGVDIAKRKHWACIMDGHTELPVGKAFWFENTREGFGRLVQHIAAALQVTGATRAVIGMEPSGHYWKPLAVFLRAQGLVVVTVNPHHIKKAKEFEDNSPTKSDRKDAWLIARRVNEADFFHPYLPDGLYADLRGLSQIRQQQRSKLTMATNQMHALLDEYFPEYSGVFVDLLGVASLYILHHLPFPADLLSVSEEELTARLRAATHHHVGLKRAQALQGAARQSVGVWVGLESARLRLRHILAEIDFWKQRMSETETAMAKALAGTGLAPYLLSVPGVGVVTAAGFLGEVGDLNRYEDWRQIRKLAGFNLVEETSGQHKGRTRISKRGRPALRTLLYNAAVGLAARNPQFRALYDHLRTRSENPLKKKQALVALSCKLLRVLFTVGRERVLYDPEKVLGVYRSRQLELTA